MTAMLDTPARSAETFTIRRTFDAPRALVWAAITEPEHLMQWWAAPGTTPGVSKMDLRPGGRLLYSMQLADGSGEMWGKWDILEVTPPSRLTAITGFSDPDGGTTRHPMAPDWPLHNYSEMDLDERDGKTTLTISWTPYQAAEAERAVFLAHHASMTGGWTFSLDRLQSHLASQ